MKNFYATICNLRSDNRGVAALLTVVIVAAAALLTAFSASVLGIGDADMSYTAQKGEQAFYLATGCAEEALRHLQIDGNWPGASLSLGGGSCIIGVASSGSNRSITVAASADNFNKKLSVQAVVSGGLVTVSAWQEIN